jgi:hypothetical protein
MKIEDCYGRRKDKTSRRIIIYSEEHTERSGANEGIQRTTEAGDTKAGEGYRF